MHGRQLLGRRSCEGNDNEAPGIRTAARLQALEKRPAINAAVAARTTIRADVLNSSITLHLLNKLRPPVAAALAARNRSPALQEATTIVAIAGDRRALPAPRRDTVDSSAKLHTHGLGHGCPRFPRPCNSMLKGESLCAVKGLARGCFARERTPSFSTC